MTDTAWLGSDHYKGGHVSMATKTYEERWGWKLVGSASQSPNSYSTPTDPNSYPPTLLLTKIWLVLH